MDTIQQEMTKIKNENWLLKDKEKNYKMAVKETEQEREDYKFKLLKAEKTAGDYMSKFQELERDLQLVLCEREQELKEISQKENMSKDKECEKVKMMDDVKGLINKFKQERKQFSQSGISKGSHPVVTSPLRESNGTHYYSLS